MIGKPLRINDHPYTIIGVAPAVFQGTQTGLRAELWVPLMMQAGLDSNRDKLQTRGETSANVDGPSCSRCFSRTSAGGEDLLMNHIVEQFPTSHLGANAVTLYPLWRAPFGANAYMYVLLPMLMAIAGVVLLLASPMWRT